MVRSEVIDVQQSNNVIIHTSHAVTCLTSLQWCSASLTAYWWACR